MVGVGVPFAGPFGGVLSVALAVILAVAFMVPFIVGDIVILAISIADKCAFPPTKGFSEALTGFFDGVLPRKAVAVSAEELAANSRTAVTTSSRGVIVCF